MALIFKLEGTFVMQTLGMRYPERLGINLVLTVTGLVLPAVAWPAVVVAVDDQAAGFPPVRVNVHGAAQDDFLADDRGGFGFGRRPAVRRARDGRRRIKGVL